MPPDDSKLLLQTDTEYAHYEVWDTPYGGRPARVLYSGRHRTAQSGVPHDDNPNMLFDYNQRLFEMAVGLQSERLLLIGGGVYTLPTALLGALPDVYIDVVELDAGLDAIAEQFFDFRSNDHLRVVHTDGRQYLDSNTESYDLLIVDAFMGAGTPDSLKEIDAIKSYRHNLRPQGVFARNVISAYGGESAAALHRQLKDYDMIFGGAEIFPASYAIPLGVPQNLLLVAQVPPRRNLRDFLRYRPLERT